MWPCDWETTLTGSVELCYNIRYVDMHGRQKSDPWSFRNTAVSHTFRAISNHSQWMFVSLPKPVIAQMECSKLLAQAKGTLPFTHHLHILSYCVSNWRPYINHLEAMCEEIVRTSALNSDILLSGHIVRRCNVLEIRHFIRTRLRRQLRNESKARMDPIEARA